jgi:hypothetical protein
MKPQFSLATLLVCLTMLGVVCAISIGLPVFTSHTTSSTTVFYKNGKPDYQNQIAGASKTITESRPPTDQEIVKRMAWAGPLAIIATLGALWAIRRVKSRRHAEPPGG